ncbi:MAG: histidine phosphatase family protein [Nitrospiraceae bacterium]|nr:MAG: histidine phosphatase family protein [Nitrospiraceae bacterium]
MVTTVFLIRHGETEGAETKRYKGHIDVPLSDNGIEQMKRLAAFIAKRVKGQGSGVREKEHLTPCLLHLAAIYCSDLSRAVKSADIIAGPFGVKPVIVPELKERNFGMWEGMTFDEIKEKWPDAFKSWAANPLKFSPMEGESTLEARDRAVPVFHKILNGHKGGSIAIVSHGGIIRIILCELLGIPLENIFRIEQGYGCLNIIEIHDTYPVAKLINFTV